MTYQTVKDGVALRLKGLGYSEAKEVNDFTDVPATQFANTFIIRIPETELASEDDTLSDRYRDRQTWEILIAFDNKAGNDVINRDTLYRKREEIVKDLDNPANWKSYVLYQRYQSSSVEVLENYFLLTIVLEIKDQVTY